MTKSSCHSNEWDKGKKNEWEDEIALAGVRAEERSSMLNLQELFPAQLVSLNECKYFTLIHFKYLKKNGIHLMNGEEAWEQQAVF